jgi:uncharacterized protein YuzB (UPF0349 family)
LINKIKKVSICFIEEVITLFKPIIEFCLSNLASGSEPAKLLLEQDDKLDVIDYGCLGMCGQCGESLFALVDGEMVTGETPDELVQNVYKHIEENPMF